MLEGSKRNKDVYRKISQEMEAAGFSKTSEQCNSKMKNVMGAPTQGALERDAATLSPTREELEDHLQRQLQDYSNMEWTNQNEYLKDQSYSLLRNTYTDSSMLYNISVNAVV